MIETQLQTNYQNIIEKIQTLSQNPINPPKLIAVSKTFPISDICELYELGQRDFGENYIQEFSEKIQQLNQLNELNRFDKLNWHIIGHIQSNKSRIVAENAHWVHTIDREKLAQRLNDQRPEHLPPLNVLIEINIGQEPNKHGINPIESEMLGLANKILELKRLKLRGLMCVASADIPETQLKQQFQRMNQLSQTLQKIAPNADRLSMGMSGDLQCAIECGANMVRIGSAIFGNRNYG